MRARRPVSRAALVATGASLATAVLCLPGCSAHLAGSGGSPAPGSSAGRTAVVVGGGDAQGQPPELRVRSRVTRVYGHLSDVRRERVAQQARHAVLDYLRGAFSDGGRPFRDFVPALRPAAQRDAAVLQEAGAGATHATVWFSVVAPAGRPVGITARVAVELPATTAAAGSLTGRLLLTEVHGAWRVFGYDLARGTQ